MDMLSNSSGDLKVARMWWSPLSRVRALLPSLLQATRGSKLPRLLRFYVKYWARKLKCVIKEVGLGRWIRPGVDEDLRSLT
jgi:hypothetical protein